QVVADRARVQKPIDPRDGLPIDLQEMQPQASLPEEFTSDRLVKRPRARVCEGARISLSGLAKLMQAEELLHVAVHPFARGRRYEPPRVFAAQTAPHPAKPLPQVRG